MSMTIGTLTSTIGATQKVSALLNVTNASTLTHSLEALIADPCKRVELMAAIKQLKVTSKILSEQQVTLTDRT
jgi:hypothetical protein